MLCAVPLDVRAWLEAQANRNLAPMSSVMVASIRKVMDAERQEITARAGESTQNLTRPPPANRLIPKLQYHKGNQK
jgi:hypothetical protein